MIFGCANLNEIVHGLPLVEECDQVRNGALRLSTPFVYPNGEHIDVFIERTQSLYETYLLSDYGQTGLFLRDLRVQNAGTARKKQVVEDVLRNSGGVKLKQGDLYLEITAENVKDISEAIFRLAQVCVRIADFALHQRLRSPNPFRDDVEEFFAAHKLTAIPDAKVMSKFNKPIRMDFSVMAAHRMSYVLVLGSMNEASAHNSALEIFRKWYDLGDLPVNRVSVYNSASSVVKTEDVERLREKSNVISYPDEQDSLLVNLTGAAA
jgi:hypothetical protein